MVQEIHMKVHHMDDQVVREYPRVGEDQEDRYTEHSGVAQDTLRISEVVQQAVQRAVLGKDRHCADAKFSSRTCTGRLSGKSITTVGEGCRSDAHSGESHHQMRSMNLP